MRFASIKIVLGLLGVMVLADSALAGPVRRVWERRKTELRGELSGELSAKLDRDVAAVGERLQDATTAQVQAEADKLHAQFQTHSQQLAAQVQSEAQKLNQLVQQEMALLRRQAADQIAAEAKQLRSQNDEQIQALRTAAEKQLQAALAKLNDQLAVETKQLIASHEAKWKLATDELKAALQSSLQTEMAKVPDQIAMLSATHADKLRAEMLELARTEIKSLAESLTPTPPTAPAEPNPAQEQAVILTPIKPVEDDSPEPDVE